MCWDCSEVSEPAESLWSWVLTQQVFAERLVGMEGVPALLEEGVARRHTAGGLPSTVRSDVVHLFVVYFLSVCLSKGRS